MLSRLRSLLFSPSACRACGFLFLLLLLSSSSPVVEGNVRLCGQRLTRALFQLCRNQICGSSAAFSPAKRSQLSMLPLVETHRSVKRSGIATQCCMNKCSYAYLKTYCCID